jgi:hypothetical protein
MMLPISNRASSKAEVTLVLAVPWVHQNNNRLGGHREIAATNNTLSSFF